MNKVKGTLRPLRERVIVSDMQFGEQLSKSGLIIPSTNGKDSGIHPRWGKVFAKGSENTEEYQVGDWILIEHGRWTRTINLESDTGEDIPVWMVDDKCIMLWSKEKPTNIEIGNL
jgi:co-chaperonin GroES (HSP10)